MELALTTPKVSRVRCRAAVGCRCVCVCVCAGGPAGQVWTRGSARFMLHSSFMLRSSGVVTALSHHTHTHVQELEGLELAPSSPLAGLVRCAAAVGGGGAHGGELHAGPDELVGPVCQGDGAGFLQSGRGSIEPSNQKVAGAHGSESMCILAQSQYALCSK